MIKLLITYYDKDVDSYEPLQVASNFTNWNDFKSELTIAIKKRMKLEDLGQFVHKVVFAKGLFDNESGEIKLINEELDLDEIILTFRKDYVEAAKEAEKKLEGQA